MARSRRSRPVVLLALVAVVVSGAWFVRGLSAERRDARARWEEREPTAYSFTYGYCGGMCASCPERITVRDGRVVDAVAQEPDCGDPDPAHALTIEDLFEIAEDHQPRPFGRTSVSYDDRWGFPSAISFTCGEGVTDCGGGWSVRDFTVVE